jgi:hypothetical protein
LIYATSSLLAAPKKSTANAIKYQSRIAVIFDHKGLAHEYLPEGQSVNQILNCGIHEQDLVKRNHQETCKNDIWLHRDNEHPHTACLQLLIWKNM